MDQLKVDTKNRERGPMPLPGRRITTVSHAIADSSFKHERKNEGVTEVVELEGRRPLADDRPRLARGLDDGDSSLVKRFV